MTKKRITAVLLMLALLVSMFPTSAFAAINPDETAYYREGSVIIGGDGGTYQFPASEQGYIKIRYIDLATGKWKVYDGQYEHGNPKRTYVLKQGDTSYRGYCIEHGVSVDTGRKLTANEQHEAIYAGLSDEAAVNLQLALFYGYQSGDDVNDLYSQGFTNSKYYGKNAASYSWGDWYVATQCIIWEIQQGNRTDDMKRQTNELGVGGDHYLSMIRNRPAVDVYNWMVSSIKEHKTFPKAVSGTEKNPKTISLTEAMKTADGYEWSFNDTTGNGGGYVVLTRSGKELKDDKITITYDEQQKKYTLHLKGEPNEEGYMVKHAAQGKIPKNDLLFWGWASGASHVQTIVTGAADPVARYIKLTIEESTEPETPPEEGTPQPEPEYVPTFEIPIEKIDLNPGWDGDVHTGMGDASLGVTYNLYRSIDGGSEELIDSITLDEWGNQQVFYDTPWDIEYIKASKMESGMLPHEETDDEGNVTHSCTVEPLMAEWSASVTYRIEEIRPDGRFTQPDSGERTYAASYYAVTENSQACTDEPENWSEITYTVTWDDGTITGTIDTVETDIAYNLQTFINDCYRGRIFLSKSNETGDVFSEEGSSGSQEKSTNSKWKVKLQSGGWEDHPYLSFADEGLDRFGTRVYRAVRDTSGTDNAATDLTVGTNGCIYIYDIPYGTYLVEEVAADDTSYVLESFIQFVGEHNNGYYPDDEEKDNRYDWNLRDKKKENVIKVIKTDAETGKQVSAENLKNAKLYIRYMGSPLSTDPTKDKNYGRLLPNAADINSASKDYTFTADNNGQIVIPYDLEFGIYRIEEWLLPEGYFVGEYDADGNAKSHSYAELFEGQSKVLASGDMYESLVTIYDDSGAVIKDGEYKLNEIFNYYTFSVTKQEGHLDGTEYIKYYQAAAMPNNQVKGRIEITKEGEVLTGFKEEKVDGHTVMTPVYETAVKVKDAVYGIYAAVDAWLADGNDGPAIHDAVTDEQIIIPTTKSTHAGNLLESVKGALSDFFAGFGDVYETGEMQHSSGAKLWFLKDRDAAEDGEYTRIYLTPEQKPTSYTYAYETTEGGINYRYDVEVLMEYMAGGKNVTDVNLTKTISASNGYLPGLEEYITLPTAAVGDYQLPEAENYESAYGNILDVYNGNDLYHADGKEVTDADGTLIKDLGDIGVSRYTAADYDLYKLSSDDVKTISVTITPGIDNNGDGDFDDPGVDNNGDGLYDGEGETAPDVPPVSTERTSFEASNFDTDLYTSLVNPAEGMPAVKKVWSDLNGDTLETEDEVTYAIYVKGYWQNAAYVEQLSWIPCDTNGTITPEYAVPDGWTEVPFTDNPADKPHYVIISKTEDVFDEQGQPSGNTETVYRVLLSDKATWQDCKPNGDFEKMYVQVYDVTYTQSSGNEEGFTFSWDGITIASAAKDDGTAVTAVSNPFSIVPVIDLGIGYTQESTESTSYFTAAEPSAPIYFMSRDGVKTEMYYFGGLTKTILTIPMDAVEANFAYCVPLITFGMGDDAQVIDWYAQLSPDKPVFEQELMTNNTIRAERMEGADGEDVTYIITILSDQKMAEGGDEMEAGERPFSITYADGYTASIYCGTSTAGYGLGVLELSSIYKTNRYSTSELIEILTTGEDGKAASSLLPLGKYIIRELSAPDGYVTDDTSYEVELSYKDQFTPIIWKFKNFFNQAVNVEIDLVKVFETAYQSGEYVPAGGAVFGLYSAEKISSETASELYESTISTDTLIDVIKVSDSGKALSTVKLPEGYYYLKELSTRNGYALNDKPFYFAVSDSLKAEADEFTYEADGISGNLYMDRYGKVIVNVDTQVRYPAASLTVDGISYDLASPFYEAGITNEVTSAYSNVEVVVNNGQTREILLSNGKALTVQVKENAYTYTLDGVEKEVVPTVSAAGYFAEYEAFFTPVKGECLEEATDKIDFTFAGAAAPSVTVEITHTPVTKEVTLIPEIPGIDNNDDGLYDGEGEKEPVPAVTKLEGVLDKDGYQTYTHQAKVQKYEAAAEDAYFTVEAGGYVTLKFDEAEPSVTAELSEDGKLSISTYDVVKEALEDSAIPKAALNGKDVTEDMYFAKSVTFARQDREAETIQVKVNTFDNVNAGPVKNDLNPPKETPEEPPKEPDIPYIPTPNVPSIRTSAVDGESGEKTALADKSITIVDTVTFYNLTIGKDYVVKGILMDKDTGEPLLAGGKTVTTEAVFTPVSTNGSVDVTFLFDGTSLSGKTTVVFEELFLLTDTDGDGKPDKEEPAAEHKDINDEKQTVKLMQKEVFIGTTAVDGKTGEKTAKADKSVTIIDTVSYENLLPGCEYVLKGSLMVKDTGKALKVDGKKITAEKIFVPTCENGTVDMKFTFDASTLNGKSVVVFEELYLRVDTDDDGKPDDIKLVAEHKDIQDEGQTVSIKKKVGKVEVSTDPKEDETGKVANVPKTGDDSTIYFYLALMLLSLALLSIILLCSRNTQKKYNRYRR